MVEENSNEVCYDSKDVEESGGFASTKGKLGNSLHAMIRTPTPNTMKLVFKIGDEN